MHVNDASLVAVNVMSALLDDDRRTDFDDENRADQERVALRSTRAEEAERPLITLRGSARASRCGSIGQPPNTADGRRFTRPARRSTKYRCPRISRYIDWTFFFAAWEIRGRFPKVLDDPKVGEAARELFENGQAILQRILDEHLLEPRGVYGFWPANSVGDDIVLFADESREREILRFNMLRQQRTAEQDRPTLCLADFIAPLESGVPDYLGAFAVTTGIGADALSAQYEAALDDYNSIMVKAIADRLAEAYAEYLHQRVRVEWGIGDPANMPKEDLVRERYRGIRPAFGYPACPDHSEKIKLFDLLEARPLGIELTETCAMIPGASVSGIYFSHAKSRYFAVGEVGEDQQADYDARKRR